MKICTKCASVLSVGTIGPPHDQNEHLFCSNKQCRNYGLVTVLYDLVINAEVPTHGKV